PKGTAYGPAAGSRMGPGRCWTLTAWTAPVPAAARHSMSSPRQVGQTSRGYQNGRWHATHQGSTSRRSRVASQNRVDASVTGGSKSVVIVSYPSPARPCPSSTALLPSRGPRRPQGRAAGADRTRLAAVGPPRRGG